MTKSFATIVHALLTHGTKRVAQPFVSFGDGEDLQETWTFGDTLERTQRAAGALRACGIKPGDRIIIVGGNEPAVVAVLLGAMASGILPAIVHAPLRADAKAACAQLSVIIARARPALVLAPPELWSAFPPGLPHLSAGELLASGAPAVDLQLPSPETPSYLQFSSGSTGAQKAVMLSAGAQAANAAATGSENQVADDETWVSWLPLYHDMGLMAGILIPLYFGHQTVLLPPERFVERPMIWLAALSRHRGTLTAAPNFAYALAARRATPERLAGLDLSSLRVAFNGAEMVMASTVEQFERAFAGVGLKANTVRPVYGLAEFTLSAAYWRLGQPMRVDTVARRALARGRAEPPLPRERRVATFVSVGQAVFGHALRIVGADGRLCDERQIGEIELMGPSRMSGYFGDAALTATVLDGDWLKTGDLGYVVDGDLFVCGRKKDLVIRFGENFHPTDLEAAAATAPGVKQGRIAVIGVYDPGWATERIWLVIESPLAGEGAVELAQTVRVSALKASGIKFDGISIVPVGFIDKTSSGKVRRSATRDKLYGLFRGNHTPPSVGRWPG